MIQELLPSIALIGSGAYMLWKNRSSENEVDAQSTTSSNSNKLDPNSNVQKIIDAHRDGGDTSVNQTEDYNARGESTIVEDGEKTELSTSNAMYFGDKGAEYDQFYDYTTNPHFNTQALLDKSVAVASQRASAMRCRIVAPFLAETDAMNIVADKYYFTYAGNTMKVSEEMKSYIDIEGKLIPCREFFGGTKRHVAFVLEIFNPFKATSHVSQIVLDEIKIGGEVCQVINDGGYCHDADKDQMKKANKHVYSGDSSKTTAQAKPFVMDVDIDINGQDSAFVPIVLPLMVIDKTIRYDVYEDGKYGKIGSKLDEQHAGLYLESLLKAYDLHSWYWENSHSMVECIKGDCKNHGVQYVVINQCKAPQSLVDKNISVKVILTSASGIYTYNTENGKEDIDAGTSTAILSMKHTTRNGYESTSDWQDSYMGKELPTIMSGAEHRYDVRNALADNIFKCNKGYSIQSGFPKKTKDASTTSSGLGAEYSFTNDFTHTNLG